MKIAKSASLPYELIRGTVKERQIKCRALAEEIFYKIIKKPDDLSLTRLQQITEDTLTTFAKDGRKINISVDELGKSKHIEVDKSIANKGIITGIEDVISNKGVATGFRITVPAKNGAIEGKTLQHFMHELSHVLQQLFDPRQISCLDEANLTPEQAKRVAKFYYNNLYDYELFDIFKPITTKIKQKFYLRGIDDTDKIKVLKEYKHRLESEELAYWEEEKFEARAFVAGFKTSQVPEHDNFLYMDKVEYLNKEIARLIKKVGKSK